MNIWEYFNFLIFFQLIFVFQVRISKYAVWLFVEKTIVIIHNKSHRHNICTKIRTKTFSTACKTYTHSFSFLLVVRKFWRKKIAN